jgi:hypothetical protein
MKTQLMQIVIRSYWMYIQWWKDKSKKQGKNPTIGNKQGKKECWYYKKSNHPKDKCFWSPNNPYNKPYKKLEVVEWGFHLAVEVRYMEEGKSPSTLGLPSTKQSYLEGQKTKPWKQNQPKIQCCEKKIATFLFNFELWCRLLQEGHIAFTI